MRPKKLRQCGVMLVYAGGTSRRPPQTDCKFNALSRGAACESGGIVFGYVPKAPRARTMFPPGPEGDEAFGAHLDALGSRLREAERNAKYADAEPVSRGKKKWRALLFRGPGQRVRWADLRTLRCAGCRKTLLGPSEECVRADAVRRGPFGRNALAQLPPPVAGRVHDRPVCSECLKLNERAAS